MDDMFYCDLCHQWLPFRDWSQEEMICASGWTVCTRCAPLLQSRLAMRQVPPVPAQSESSPILPNAGLPVGNVEELYQEKREWFFPHIVGSNCQPERRSRALIDGYTASYMRWQSKVHVVAWLNSFDQQQALRPVFLDTETTGTRRFSEIIEVCIVDEFGKTLFHSLVNPTTEIEPMASAVHGLTHEHVKSAPRYPEIHEEVMRHLRNRVVIGYLVSFDIRLLKQTADCYELSFPELHTGCLMYAYAKYRNLYIEQSNGRYRYKTYRLEEAVKEEGLKIPPSHRAERDAYCTYQLFQKLRRSIC